MKHSLFRCLPVAWIAVLLFSSCSTYYFSHPQPVDAISLTAFPAAMQGNWITDEKDRVLIEPGNIGLIQRDTNRVVAGAWPEISNGRFVYPPNGYLPFSTIRYNSARQPVDTTPNYLIHEPHIYAYTDSVNLEAGFHFTRLRDTFTVYKLDTVTIDLGTNAQLRELGEGFYTVSFRSQVIGDDNRWWQFFIMEQPHRDTLRIWYCAGGLTRDPSMFYHVNNTWYFNSAWTRQTVLKLVKAGYFEMCNVLTRAHG